MAAMTLETYAAYVAVLLVAVILPGPTNTLIVANGMRHGTRAGMLNVAGTQLGVAIMILVAAIGLTSFIQVLGHWFEALKFLGAAYLAWIGFQMMRSSGRFAEMKAPVPPRAGFFMQGFLVAMSNPKQLLFFGALLPQFIDPSTNHVLQIAVYGATAIFIGTVSDGCYALAAGRIARGLTRRRARLVNRVGGGCLIGGGVLLALSQAR